MLKDLTLSSKRYRMKPSKFLFLGVVSLKVICLIMFTFFRIEYLRDVLGITTNEAKKLISKN